RMVDNTREFHQRLNALGLPNELLVAPGRDHAGNAFVSSVQVLDFALQP
ncbi:MAG: alpha/beta hydrolase, partial [Pseudomonadales bacterium]